MMWKYVSGVAMVAAGANIEVASGEAVLCQVSGGTWHDNSGTLPTMITL